MSVVAWDGKILAADRQSTYGDTKSSTDKIFLLPNGEVVAFVGPLTAAVRLKRWYDEGADPAKYPPLKKDEDWTKIIVASKDRICFTEGSPDFIPVIDPFCAWGVGREAALGALEMGANAPQAVAAACKWICGCGMGVVHYRVRG